MKKLNILRLLSTVAIAAAGVFGTASVKESKKAEVAEAASTACDVYFGAYWTGGNIKEVKVHYWNGGDYWMAMTEVFRSGGSPVYKYTIPAGNSEFQYQICCNWGSGDEWKTSVNKTVTHNMLCWPAESWDGSNFRVNQFTAYPYTITYNGNGETSGSMASHTAYGNVTWGLNANTYSKTGYVFDSWNTKANGTGTKYSNQALLPEKSDTNNLTLYAQWRKSYTSGRYVVDSDLNMDNATLMTNTDNQYVATVTLSYKQAFKSAWYNNDNGVLDNWYGYSRFYSGCGAYHYFSVDSDDNIVCYARGTYIIYVNNDNISIELQNANVLTSEHLAAQLMSFGESPSSGHCGDANRFPAMKSIYLNKLNATEKSTFQSYSNSSEDQFKNAYDRYVDWAKALGENPWAEGKVNSPSILPGIASQSTNTVIMIVVISLVSVGAVGGYFFIRRRKENN